MCVQEWEPSKPDSWWHFSDSASLAVFFFFSFVHTRLCFFFVCVFLKRIIKFPISFFLAVIRERDSVFCWTAETTQV